MSCLVLESDAPALSPEKEQRNHPYNIRMSRDAIAKIKGDPVCIGCEMYC